MKFLISVPLNTSSEQFIKLKELQLAFAKVCNVLAPEVQRSRVWNRVALHHMHYRSLREKFPAIGSQMICNAIYAVSRTSRLVFQTPESPFSLAKLGEKPLPLLIFTKTSPVFFDWHTLSIKKSKLSLFSLDGRIHFDLLLPEEQLLLFKTSKLFEISLNCPNDTQFVLSFSLGSIQNKFGKEPLLELDSLGHLAQENNESVIATQFSIPNYVAVKVEV